MKFVTARSIAMLLALQTAVGASAQTLNIGDAYSHCTPAERSVVDGMQEARTVFFLDSAANAASLTIRRPTATDDNLISATFSAIRKDPPGSALPPHPSGSPRLTFQLVSRVHGQCLAPSPTLRADGSRTFILKPCDDTSHDTYWLSSTSGITGQLSSAKAQFLGTGRIDAPGHAGEGGIVYTLRDSLLAQQGQGNVLNGVINVLNGALRVGGAERPVMPSSWLCSGPLFAENRIPRTGVSSDLHPWSGSNTDSQVVTNDYMIRHFRRALTAANHDVVSDPNREAADVAALVNFGRANFPDNKALRDIFFLVAATSRERQGPNWLIYARDRVREFDSVLMQMARQATSTQANSVAGMQQLLDAVGINNINQALADSGRALTRLDTNAKSESGQVPNSYGAAARLDRELRRALLANSTVSDSSSGVEHVDPKYSAGYGMSATIAGQFRLPVVRTQNLFGIAGWDTTQNLRVSVPVFSHQRTNMYDGPIVFPSSTNTTVFTVSGAMSLNKLAFSLPNWRPVMQQILSPVVGVLESANWVPEIEVHVTVRCTNGISASNCIRDQVSVGVVADRTLFDVKKALTAAGLYIATESVRRGLRLSFLATEADTRATGQTITRVAYMGAISALNMLQYTLPVIDVTAMGAQLVALRNFYWSASDAVSEMEAGVLNTIPTGFLNAASQLRTYMPQSGWHSSIFTEGGLHAVWVRDAVSGSFPVAPSFVQLSWTNFVQANGAMTYNLRRDPVTGIARVNGSTQIRVQGSVAFPILLPTTLDNVKLLTDPRVRQNLAAAQAAISGSAGGD